jgi:hypothetical protein
MATCVVPVLVWQDYAGLFSAATAEPLADELSLVVEWAGSRFLTAVDRSAAGALKQI